MKNIVQYLPRALAAAILSAGLSAFLLASAFDPVADKAFIVSFMLLCAVFTAALDLTRLSARVIVMISALCAAAGAAFFLLIRGEWSVPLALLLCGSLCSALSLLNRSFAARCVIAAGMVSFLLASAWLRIELLRLPAILLTAYPLLVLCQICGPIRSDDPKKKYDVWHVAFCLALSALVFLLPHAGTRIRWEKVFDIRPSERLDLIGERLGIERYETPDLNESGISDDQSSLGGWLNLNTDIKLWLQFSSAPHPDRLTANIYDLYTGSGWECAVSPDGTGYYPDGFQPETGTGPVPDDSGPVVSGSDISGSDVAGTDAVTGSDIVQNKVHVKKFIPYSNKNKENEEELINRSRALFYPPYTYGIISDNGGEIAARAGQHMEFASAPPSDYTAYYTDSGEQEPLTDTQKLSCLALPDTLPGRVRELAVSMTDACVTDEEKAYAITDALSSYIYDKQVQKQPAGEDFVDWFLFESGRGYCQYFASAEAVLARCAGIPSRYVIGYSVPDNRLSLFLSDKNAHAWAELYIDGKGWTVYDPLFFETEASDTDAPPDDGTGSEEIERERRAVSRLLGFAYIAIAAGVLLVLLTRTFFRRMVWFIKLRRKYRGHPQYAVLRRCGRLLWALAACGVRRGESETIREFSRRISGQCEWLPDGLLPNIHALLIQAETAVYSTTSVKRSRTDNPRRALPAAVKFSYIRENGLIAYIRIHRKYTPD